MQPTATLRQALFGLLLALPFLALNAIVAMRIEPFLSLLRPGAHTSPAEYVLLPVTLLLILLGSWAAARPVLRERKWYTINVLVAALLFGVFLLLSTVLGVETYRCDILHIPNCD